jgi:hypothetical protein
MGVAWWDALANDVVFLLGKARVDVHARLGVHGAAFDIHI